MHAFWVCLHGQYRDWVWVGVYADTGCAFNSHSLSQALIAHHDVFSPNVKVSTGTEPG